MAAYRIDQKDQHIEPGENLGNKITENTQHIICFYTILIYTYIYAYCTRIQKPYTLAHVRIFRIFHSSINKQAIIRCRSTIFNILKCCTNQAHPFVRFRSLHHPVCHLLALSLVLSSSMFCTRLLYHRLSLSNKLDLILLIFVIYLKCRQCLYKQFAIGPAKLWVY